MRVTELAESLKTPIVYHGQDLEQIEIHGVAAIAHARPGDLTFLGSPDFQKFVAGSTASAIIVREALDDFKGPQLVHKDPHFAYAKAASLFYQIDHGPKGVHPTAVIGQGVQLGSDVIVGPYCVVGDGCILGDRAVLYSHVVLGKDVEIGVESILYSHAVVYFGCKIGARCILHAGTVIGADGFGFAVSAGEICKIPQVGIVRIADDVECGALVTIDRAAFGETRIGPFSKFDDKVHIGHNVTVGDHCMFSAFTGVAGSTEIGSWVLVGGHSGISDHLKIADGSRIGAKTGVIQSIEKPGGTHVGFPAEPAADWKRGVVHMRNLGDYARRIRELEKRLARLENQVPSSP